MSPVDWLFGIAIIIGAVLAFFEATKRHADQQVPRYNAVYMREPGVDVIIVPVEPSFANTPPSDQRAFEANLQTQASAAGLTGIVVPVCDLGQQGMFFRAPPHLHPFFQSIDMAWVIANLNQEIYW